MFLYFSLRRGYSLLRKGETEAARHHFLDLVRRFPERAEPHFELGKLCYKTDDWTGAQEHLLTAVEHNPSKAIIEGILELTNWWMVGRPDAFHSSPTFSPDGKKLLFCSARQDTNQDGKIDATDRAGIYLFDLETGSIREMVSNEYHNTSPVWSPEGHSFAYLSKRWAGQGSDAAEGSSLVLRNIETGAETLIVHPAGHPRYPAFTPDGSKIVVCTIDQVGGPSGISLAERGSHVRSPLTSHAWEHTFPQISPDGRYLLYVSWRRYTPQAGRRLLDENPGIYLMGLDTGKEQELVNDRYCNAYPRFSPDSRSVVFLSRRRDTNHDGQISSLDNFGIYTIRLSDRKETCVSADDHFNKFATWSSDGKSILFLARWPSKKEKASWESEDYFEYKGVYRVPAAGGTPHAIVSDKYFGSRFCEVAPKGGWVAYVSWRRKTNRGLYIANYEKLPSLTQLRSFIKNNLTR